MIIIWNILYLYNEIGMYLGFNFMVNYLKYIDLRY